MALKKTHAAFRAMLAQARSDIDEPGEVDLAPPATVRDALRQERVKTRALWWFVENVGADDPAQNEIFFELRALVRS